MTQSNKIKFENILLDNHHVPIDITLSPPSQSKNNSDLAITNRSQGRIQRLLGDSGFYWQSDKT